MRAAAAGIILLATALCSAKESRAAILRTSTGRPFAARVENAPGIKNVAMITPRIARGGQPRSKGFRFLKDHGFKTVISLREHHDEKEPVEAAGLKWIHIPLQADLTGSSPPTDNQIQAFFGAILDPVNQSVYFHCALGKDRTGTMAALYRMEVDGWTAEEAIEEMDAFGAHGLYKSLTDFVKNYEPSGRWAPASRKAKSR